MADAKGRLDRVRLIDRRIHNGDGTWSGEYYYEWACGCRIYIPVFRDGSLGADHRDEYCREHFDGLLPQPERLRACHG
jgi:hypothetical protein